jgi:5-methylcytosine-specific restriction protein B
MNNPTMVWVAEVVDHANRLLGDRHLQIGPSHFMVEDLDDVLLRQIWRYSIRPYVEEHFFDDPDRVADFELDALRGALASDTMAEVEADDDAPPGTQ